MCEEFADDCKGCKEGIKNPKGSCARHFVAASLGVNKIPAELGTRDFDEAARIIRNQNN